MAGARIRQMLESLRQQPMTANQLRPVFGGTTDSYLSRLQKAGAVSRRRITNPSPAGKHVPQFAWEYFVIAPYVAEHGISRQGVEKKSSDTLNTCRVMTIPSKRMRGSIEPRTPPPAKSHAKSRW